MDNGKFQLIWRSERKNEFFNLCFPGFQAFIMSFDHFKFADLFRCDITVNSVTEFRKFLFQTFINKGFKVKRCICGIFQKFIQYRLSRFAEGVRNNVSQLDIGNRETVLQTILFALLKEGQFEAVTHKVTELADVSGCHKTTDNKIMLKQVSNLFGIFLVSLPSTDSLNIFGMSKDNRTVIF